MKKQFLLSIFSVLAILKISAQDKEHLFHVSVSNNGQLHEVIEDFYFDQDGYGPSNDVFSYEETVMKFNLHYEFINSKNLIISSSFGYGFRQDDYRVGNQTGIPPIGEKSQKYLSASLGLRRLWKMDRLHFSTGMEIPIFWMSEYEELYLQDNPDRVYHFREITTGGSAFGLNSTSSIKWFLSDRYYLASNISFGVIHFNVGEMTTSIVEEQDPVVHGEDMWERENTYKKITFTQPELFLGVGFRL